MKKEIEEFLNQNINEEMIQIIISKSRHKDGPSKVKIRPILLKDKLAYQASETVEAQVLHRNYERWELIVYITELMEERFMQLQLEGQNQDGLILVSKKGKVTMKTKRHAVRQEKISLEHNRKKKYILPEGTVVPFLVDLGVMNQNLAEKYGYDKLKFYPGDIASFEGVEQVDMVVTLHACDTATDYALEKAVRWKAKVILSVPCCQHELNAQISNEMLSPIFFYGILKERMAALITDGLRAKLLEGAGYETQILEFIDMEHTPKNLLIRGIYTGRKRDLTQTEKCMKELHVQPALARLLAEQEVKTK